MNIWLVPAQGLACIVVRNNQSSSGGMGCSTPASAEESGLAEISATTVAAVLPDGSSAVDVTRKDGSSVQLTPNQDGAVALSTNQPLSALTYTGPDRATHQLAVASVTPPPPGS
jgi:hypothetical protein